MTKKLTSKQTADWLRLHDDFLILTHRRPDGDSLGSAAGLCLALHAAGKRAYLLENPETTDRYAEYMIPYLAPAEFVPQKVIAVDTADAKILQLNAAEYAGRVDLAIDHHTSNTGYAAHTCLNVAAAACGEVAYDVIMDLNGRIEAAAATALYVALATDTGCFSYANVTAGTLAVAAALVQAGANHLRVNKILFRTKTRARIALDGILYSGLKFYSAGRIAVAVLTQEIIENTGIAEDDLDDVAAIPGQVAGVMVGIVIREFARSSCKVSVRTVSEVNANEICRKFGGGGHPMAAGCVVDMGPEETVAALVQAAEEILP